MRLPAALRRSQSEDAAGRPATPRRLPPLPLSRSQLPARSDWRSKVDPGSGKTYYVNSATKQSKWHPPFDVAAVPSDWVTKTDPTTGKPYYVNTVTKKSVWVTPAAAEDEEITADNFEGVFSGSRQDAQQP